MRSERDVTWHPVCAVGDLADPGSRAFSVGQGDWPLRGFVVRRAQLVRAYVNVCPHAGHPLNWHPHEFLTPDRSLIHCASHGALFDVESGACVAGPCGGRSLKSLPARIEHDAVLVQVTTD